MQFILKSFIKSLFLFSLIAVCTTVNASNCTSIFSHISESKRNLQRYSTQRFQPEILRAGDIRGVFFKEFDFGFPEILAKSLDFLLNHKMLLGASSPPKILVAHDARIVSPTLSKNLINALADQGFDVVDMGLVPTPLANFSLKHFDYEAAVIVTASHNPKEYAGFKTVLNPKYKTYNIAPEINDIISNEKWKSVTKQTNATDGRVATIDFSNNYIKSLKSEFKEGLSFDSFVVDASNGSAGLLAKQVFSSFGLNPHYINIEPDGNFPNHSPDPTKKESLKQLVEKVKETKSAFGVIFDGDGDRLVIVSSKGEIIESDKYAYLFLDDLKKSKSKTIVADIKVSNWFVKKARNLGFEVVLEKTGYYFLKKRMSESRAAMAVERSGHIMLNDRKNRGIDDGIYNTLRFIEIVGQQGLDVVNQKLDSVSQFKTYQFNLHIPPKEGKQAIDLLKKHLDKKGEEYISIDGVRIERGDTWAVFRSSQTENLTSLDVQAPNLKTVFDIVNEVSGVIEREFKFPKDLSKPAGDNIAIIGDAGSGSINKH